MKSPAAPALAALFTVVAHAQEPAQGNAGEQMPLPLRVLKSWRTDFGDHSIYLNRVAPPVLQTAPATNAEPARDAVLATADPADGKKFEVLFLAATVHDHQFTEIWCMCAGRERRVFSNLDFNLLDGLNTIESADTRYSLILLISNVTTRAEDLAQTGAQAAAPDRKRTEALAKLSPLHAQYVVADDEEAAPPPEKALTALDALHLFHDANRQQLAGAHAQREAARIAAESKPQPAPPKPPDAVVNFWPGAGTRIIESPGREALR